MVYAASLIYILLFGVNMFSLLCKHVQFIKAEVASLEAGYYQGLLLIDTTGMKTKVYIYSYGRMEQLHSKETAIAEMNGST